MPVSMANSRHSPSWQGCEKSRFLRLLRVGLQKRIRIQRDSDPLLEFNNSGAPLRELTNPAMLTQLVLHPWFMEFASRCL